MRNARPEPAPPQSRFAAGSFTVGIISDTHGLLRPAAVSALTGCDAIIHAGDIGSPDVITTLSTLAPVTAVRGNVDRDAWARAFPESDALQLAGRFIYVLHNLHELNLDPAAGGFDVVVSGHSHQPKIHTVDGVLYVNPGSAGPRRFTLPIAVAKIEMTRQGVTARVIELAT